MRTENSEEVKREMKEKNTVDLISTGSGAAKPDAEPEVEMLKYAMKKYAYVQKILFNDFKDEYKPETGSFPTSKVNLSAADPPYSTCSARAWPNSAHDDFSERFSQNGVRLTSTVVAPRAHGHVLCLGVLFHH